MISLDAFCSYCENKFLGVQWSTFWNYSENEDWEAQWKLKDGQPENLCPLSTTVQR